MALLLHVWPASGRSGGLPDWFSPEPFEVAINGSVYAVPGNYLVHVAKDHRGLTDVVTLRALWPGLEPLRRDKPTSGNGGSRNGTSRSLCSSSRATGTASCAASPGSAMRDRGPPPTG